MRWPLPICPTGCAAAVRSCSLGRRMTPGCYDVGEPDGMIGARTRQALQAAQRELGLPADGRAGQKALKALKASAATKTSG
ncbi:hypothetical protein G6F40_017674 [Rhizopus arrhizus]|nr:hypothetical protein G6F40_017674 [Rhizopus arrhizus]